jgi:hypothetical protein
MGTNVRYTIGAVVGAFKLFTFLHVADLDWEDGHSLRVALPNVKDLWLLFDVPLEDPANVAAATAHTQSFCPTITVTVMSLRGDARLAQNAAAVLGYPKRLGIPFKSAVREYWRAVITLEGQF